MTAQVAADLRAAADVLRRDGWTQGQVHDAAGHCAVGAIEVAVDPDGWSADDGWDFPQNARFGGAVKLLKTVTGQPVTDWNDAPGRTADEVIAALLAASDAAEATR